MGICSAAASAPPAVLGTFPSAIYLRLAGREVIAVLTREAIQLPLGLTLSADSSELPLDRWTGPVRVAPAKCRSATAASASRGWVDGGSDPTEAEQGRGRVHVALAQWLRRARAPARTALLH